MEADRWIYLAAFFVRRFMGTGGKWLKKRKVRCRDEAEVLELDTE